MMVVAQQTCAADVVGTTSQIEENLRADFQLHA